MKIYFNGQGWNLSVVLHGNNQPIFSLKLATFPRAYALKKQYGYKVGEGLLLVWTHKYTWCMLLKGLRWFIYVKNNCVLPLPPPHLHAISTAFCLIPVMCQGRNWSSTVITKEFPSVRCTALNIEIASCMKRTITSKYFNKEWWSWYFSHE